MALRRDAEDSTVRGVVLAVPTDHGVIPVTNEHRAVGSYRNIYRTHPFVPRALEQIHHPCLVTRPALGRYDATQHAGSGIGRQDLVPDVVRQQATFVRGHSGRGTGSCDQQVWDHAGIVLVPVPLGDFFVAAGALGLVSRARRLVTIAIVAVLEDVVDPASVATVVVVVGLPQPA